MINKTEQLQPESTYRIYNRANGNERLFVSEENYRYFLQKYREYIYPIAHTFCYCLMPNHFHFLVRIKSQREIEASINKNLQGFGNLEGFTTAFVSQQFSNFFNAYSKAFNKQNNRKGSLFMHTFKRKKITDTRYLRKLVHYIHHNPIEADLCEKPQEWKFSSYGALLHNAPTLLQKEEVLEWFGDKENFIAVHNGQSSFEAES